MMDLEELELLYKDLVKLRELAEKVLPIFQQLKIETLCLTKTKYGSQKPSSFVAELREITGVCEMDIRSSRLGWLLYELEHLTKELADDELQRLLGVKL
jgi:hypothetical protein